MQIPSQYKNYLQATVHNMDQEYEYVRAHLKELAQYVLPQRYNALDEGKQVRDKTRNKYILDGHATGAARTLSSGMLFGATNPTHRWLNLAIPNPTIPVQRWADAVTNRTLEILGRTNSYNSLAALYLDKGVFGTSAMLIYPDDESLVRTYTLPAGEYRVMKDARGKISYLARKFRMTADQLVEAFGIENVSDQVRRDIEPPYGNRFTEHRVHHLIEPNNPPTLPEHFLYRECFWEEGGPQELVLAINGHYEKPFIAPRWEVVGNNLFGVSPGMDALPDIISLQHLARKRAVGLDKIIDPPVVVDQILRNQPTALMAGGVSYVPNVGSVGVKPAYELAIPFGELRDDKFSYHEAINRFFYTDLFRAILDLRTVRTATEIAEATAEKLVLLGPVVNRVEDELLSDFTARVLGILSRMEALPSPPEGVEGLFIKYDSILSAAQKSAGINSIERFMATVGQVIPVAPETLAVVDFNEWIREYANRLNVPSTLLRSREEVEAMRQAQAQAEAQQQQAELGTQLAQASSLLAES